MSRGTNHDHVRAVERVANLTQGSHPHKGIATAHASTLHHEAASIASAVKPEKTFRLDEANAIVPRLQILMERLQRAALRLHEHMTDLAREMGIALTDLSTDELLRHRPAARALVEELDAVAQEIEESGAHLKDVQLGLVDFPAERDGEIVYLCWQFGEPEIAFWHRIEDGFAGRRPLPGSSGPRYLQ
jgi:hypothetical protein